MDADDLVRLETAIDAKLPLPDDIGLELKAAIHQFKTGKSKTLCRALGLREPGVTSIATREKISERNAMLKEIAKQYDGETWQIAGTIAEKIKRQSREPLYRLLFEIGAKVPSDQSSIYRILLQKP